MIPLLEDLILAGGEDKTADKEKIQKITNNIADQIQRKKELIKLLNRFAHSVDLQITSFDLHDLLNDILRIVGRFAALKKVNLEINLSSKQIKITSCPFTLQHLVFQIINLGLIFCNSNDIISIYTDKDNSYEIVKIATPISNNIEEVKDEIEFISYQTRILGGKIEFSTERAKHYFTVFIPSSITELHKNN